MANLCLLSLLFPLASVPLSACLVTHTVLEWQKTFEEKLTPLLSVRESLSEEEAQKMGRKDPEQEVEKFVTSNTQELGKDKWLCPLSGKKFKVWDVKRIGRVDWERGLGSKTSKSLEEAVTFQRGSVGKRLQHAVRPHPLLPGPRVCAQAYLQ